MLSREPLVQLVRNFASAAEMDQIVQLGMPLLSKSLMQPSSGAGDVSKHRTSKSCTMGGSAGDHPVMFAVRKRITSFSGLSWKHTEPVQLVSYEAGELAEWLRLSDRVAGWLNK